jgi:hypothetical protein
MSLRVRHPIETASVRALHKHEEARDVPALAVGAQALGALALGAIAVGALAVGALAIGRLTIGRARMRHVEIDELVVRKLRVTDELQVPSQPHSETEA